MATNLGRLVTPAERANPYHLNPQGGVEMCLLFDLAVAASPHPATPGRSQLASAGLERVTPRPDSTGACAGCGDRVVFDEVDGWLHVCTSQGEMPASAPGPPAET